MTELNLLAVQNAPLLRELGKPGAAQTVNEIARQIGRDESNVRKSIKALVAAGLATDPMCLTQEGGRQLEAIDRAESDVAPLPPGLIAARHDVILPDPDNARRDWDSAEAAADLRALANDIAVNGLLQNLVVRLNDRDDGPDAFTADPQPGDLILVGGERRWRAIGLLIEDGVWGEDRLIPVRLFDATEQAQVRLAALAENLQRRNLNPIEEAQAYRGLREAGLTTEDIADRVTLTRRHVQMRLQLLEHLTEDEQRRMTLGAEDPDRLSVSDARKLVQAQEAKRKRRAEWEEILTPRQRLIMAEVRIRAGKPDYWIRVEVDGAAMNADEDAVALHKAGLLHIPTTVNAEGQAKAGFEYKSEIVTAALFMDGVEAYAAVLRGQLDLPEPAEGQLSTAWLNGPFELTPELAARIEADKAAREQREREIQMERDHEARERQARMDRMSLMRTHAEGLLAQAATPPLAPVIDDLPQIAGGLEHPLPWCATDLAVILDAQGERVMRFGNYYDHANDDEVALAMMTATAVNAAAGMATPPLHKTASADEAAGAVEDEEGADEE